MCGRFVRKIELREALELFSAEVLDSYLEPSFNVAPHQMIAVVMEDGKRKITAMQWGLIPSWAKDPKIGNKMINARAETILEKLSFRDAFKNRRCLIIADGFYEWRTEGKVKTPLYIYLKDKSSFAMAGIFENWKNESGELIKTCSIITSEANEFMKEIHHRMPVILDQKDYNTWLNPNSSEETLKDLLRPFKASEMQCHEVTHEVNSPSHNAEDCIVPVQSAS
jgi:putative SOS response-associated peptidase YedK